MTIDHDPLDFLRKFTHARIALGHAGHGLPTQELLKFRLAHSQARDSVWSEINFQSLKTNIELLAHQVIEVQSNCDTKQQFLLNPNLGRQLSSSSAANLTREKSNVYDCLLVIGDGLSAKAIHANAWDFSRRFLTLMKQSGLSMGPVVLAKFARVGLADPIGESLNSKSTVLLIGERPGLASADSMSVYFTYGPRIGNSDAQRNCISNIHSAGLSTSAAAVMTEFLVKTSLTKQLSGVDLKVEYPGLAKL